MEVNDRIVKTEAVRWRSLEWLQGGLKQISAESFEKLKQSLRVNSFIQPFNVWETEGRLFCLDGHHRKMAMEQLEAEGVTIPEALRANFIDCKDKDEAKKLVLVYSSQYATTTKSRVLDFLEDTDLELDALDLEIDIPGIDLKPGGIEDDLGEVPFTEEMNEAHNYIVLYFENDIDWLQLQTIFPTKTVAALGSKPGFVKRGVGRVVRGSEFLNKLGEFYK